MIVARNWRPITKNSLCGFVSLALEPSGLVLHDCSLHRAADDRRWIGLPAKPQLDNEGRGRRDDRGKLAYVAVVEIPDKAARERFQTAALSAVRKLLGENMP
jgi:hypothetical protein